MTAQDRNAINASPRADLQFSALAGSASSISPRAREVELVSVIIPCFKQAHFLRYAIESALAQTYPSVEIIVVDDGSPDDAARVAQHYPSVQYIRQPNSGRSAARNVGVRASQGKFLVFLDADDRLLPRAVEVGLHYLGSYPDCALVSGVAAEIDSYGAPLGTRSSGPHQHCHGGDHYPAFLHANYALINTVVLRRCAFDEVGGFSTQLHAAEDHDLYLRIARRFPVVCHTGIVAERRRHRSNTINHPARTVPFALAVLRSQRPYVRKRSEYDVAYRSGVDRLLTAYGFAPVYAIWLHTRRREWNEAAHALRLVALDPRFLWYFFKKLIRVLYRYTEHDRRKP